MAASLTLAVQEQHLRGASMAEKWDHAQRLGFDALELRGAGEGRFAARRQELRTAARAGVVMPTVCVDMPHFVGDEPEQRRDAVAQLRSQLSLTAELGGRLVMTPASYRPRTALFPPHRSAAEDHAVLLEAFGELAGHAASVGVVIALEPLNQYENRMVNRLGQAVALALEIGSPHFGVAADTYHMNIEEADPRQALLDAAPWLRHVQLSDSNRLEPGAGHLDWAATLGAISAAGYAEELAYESRLSGAVDDVLPASVRKLRALTAA